MSRLRRTYDGPTKIYFVTSNTYQRVPLFRMDENTRSVIKNIKFLEKRKDIIIIAYVIMPDHIHLLFEIISNMNVSQVMHSIKSRVAHEISQIYLNNHRQGCHALSESKRTQSVAALGMSLDAAVLAMAGKKYIRVWHRSFYDHVIKNQNDLNNHINYIHYNPVKDGLVKNPEDWAWSSFKDNINKDLA